MQPEFPNEISGVCKSSRVKFQTKQYYIPIITGSKYATPVSQLEYQVATHMYVHMFFIYMQEEQPYVITEIMKQLSLNAGLKSWELNPITLCNMK